MFFRESIRRVAEAAGVNGWVRNLIDGMVIGSNLTSQPDVPAVTAELNALMNRLTTCGGACPSDRTRTVVKASCAAVLGSAALLVQ